MASLLHIKNRPGWEELLDKLFTQSIIHPLYGDPIFLINNAEAVGPSLSLYMVDRSPDSSFILLQHLFPVWFELFPAAALFQTHFPFSFRIVT